MHLDNTGDEEGGVDLFSEGEKSEKGGGGVDLLREGKKGARGVDSLEALEGDEGR